MNSYEEGLRYISNAYDLPIDKVRLAMIGETIHHLRLVFSYDGLVEHFENLLQVSEPPTSGEVVELYKNCLNAWGWDGVGQPECMKVLLRHKFKCPFDLLDLISCPAVLDTHFKCGADPDEVMKNGFTLAHWCVLTNNLNIMKVLIRNNATLSTPSVMGLYAKDMIVGKDMYDLVMESFRTRKNRFIGLLRCLPVLLLRRKQATERLYHPSRMNFDIAFDI